MSLIGDGLGSPSVLGDNELPSTSPPLPLPAAAVEITTNSGHICARLDNGEVYCWGANDFGQLGDGKVEGQ